MHKQVLVKGQLCGKFFGECDVSGLEEGLWVPSRSCRWKLN